MTKVSITYNHQYNFDVLKENNCSSKILNAVKIFIKKEAEEFLLLSYYQTCPPLLTTRKLYIKIYKLTVFNNWTRASEGL